MFQTRDIETLKLIPCLQLLIHSSMTIFKYIVFVLDEYAYFLDLSRPHIRRFCQAITLSADKSLNVRYLPTRFHRCRRQKSASGKSLACQTFIGRYSRPAVKLPSVMLEATLSGDVLQFLHYLKYYFIKYFIKNEYRSLI